MNPDQSETTSRYRTIVADPPWQYDQRADVQTKWLADKRDRSKGASAEDVYPTMTNAEIAALPVRDMTDECGSHCYLWVTNPLMFGGSPSPLEILNAWGFTYKTLLTWNKTGPTGMGHYFRGRTEHVMFGVRGSCPIPGKVREQNIIHAANGAHSAKPDAFYDLVERVSPGPYLELFARRARLGDWHYWGNESLNTAEVAA